MEEMTSVAETDGAGVTVIETREALAALLGRLRQEPLVAFDTEAASFHRYKDRVYLLQVSSRTETAVVDPLAIGGLDGLGDILAAPDIEIVFHDGDYDLRLLNQEYGFRATRLFDTRIAAQLLNEPGIGLAALLEKYQSIRLDKRFQRADWSVRPLSQGMLDYAAADTRYLLGLRDELRGQLEARGRLGWAEEEFALLAQVRWAPAEESEPGFLRMKGAKALKGRELAVLRELYRWREDLAERGDRAAFRILNNEPIMAMAKSPPADMAGLKAISGISSDQAERRGRDILAAVQRAMGLPEGELPRIERPARRPPDPAFEERVERLKQTRNRLAAQYDLAPGVLCPNGTLEAVARLHPSTLDQLAATPGLRRWQLHEIGPALLAALVAPPTSPAPADVLPTAG